MHSERCEPRQSYKETSSLIFFLLITLLQRHTSFDVQEVALVYVFVANKAENWRALSRKQYFWKHTFYNICRCVFNINGSCTSNQYLIIPTQNLNHTNAHTFRGSLYEKKHLDYNPVKRVFRLAGMILILIWHEKFRPVSMDENVTWCCFEFSLVWFSVWVTVQPSLLSIQHSFLAFQFQDLIP